MPGLLVQVSDLLYDPLLGLLPDGNPSDPTTMVV